MFQYPRLLLAASALLAAIPCHASPTFVDATPANTTLADGTPMSLQTIVTAEDPPEYFLQDNDFETANQHWKFRGNFGNGGRIWASHGGSDSPMLRTTITGLEANAEYEISVYFWVAGNGTPVGNQEWDISAGLATDAMTDIRYNTPGALRLDTSGVVFTNTVVVTEADRRLFQYILGTAAANGDGEIQVFVDDLPGNDDRTWYDGVGFASLAPPEPAVWVGEALNDRWSTPANWLADSLPEEGDELVFGDAIRLFPLNDLPPDRSYASLRFNPEAGAYMFSGNRISLTGPIINQSAASQTLEIDLLVNDDLNVNVIDGAVFLDGELSGISGLNKSGQGTLELTAANRYSGRTTVVTGTVLVFNDQQQSAGGWWIGPGTAAPTTVAFSENAVIRVAPENGIRVGDNAGSFASGLAAQNLSVLGDVTNHGSLEIGLQAFVSLETGSQWAQHGPVAVRGYNNWNSRITIQSGASFHHFGEDPIVLRAGTGATGRGRIVLIGGLLLTGSGLVDENPGGGLRPLIEMRENAVLRVTGPVADLNHNVEIQLGFQGGIIDTAEHLVSASGPLSGFGALAKEGTGTLKLSGAILHSGSTIIREGRLVVSEPALDDQSTVQIAAGATLELDHASTDVIAALIIDGIARNPGIWGSPSSGAPNTDPALAGTGRIQIISADAYSAWIDGFASLETPGDKEKFADPDGDGFNNLAEFALDDNPTSPAASGKIQGQFAAVADGSAFTLTLPVRDAATFDPVDPASPEFVLSGDGVRYRIQASADLESWLLAVVEVTGADAAAIESSMPTLNPGWSYRTFRGPGSSPQEFLRVAIEDLP